MRLMLRTRNDYITFEHTGPSAHQIVQVILFVPGLFITQSIAEITRFDYLFSLLQRWVLDIIDHTPQQKLAVLFDFFRSPL
jgi:hypothetical protein